MNSNILSIIMDCKNKGEPCYITFIAQKLGLSHVAIKKRVDPLIEEGYVEIVNPNGKPQYLELTEKGMNILSEFELLSAFDPNDTEKEEK